MRRTTSLAGALALGTLLAAQAQAANARNPYGNVDHRNDAGNDTGDSRVDALNAGQLDRNYRGPYYYRGQAAPAGYPAPPAPASPPQAYQAPGYPPPGYAPQYAPGTAAPYPPPPPARPW